jgi:1-acyl-sn-glycerol-3-phosphate acyltransferase
LVKPYRVLRTLVHVLAGVGTTMLVFPFASDARKRQLVKRWSRKLLRILNVRVHVRGELHAVSGNVLLVANHISWLDIMAIHAVVPRARFVSKADVKAWPLVARLVDSAGTLYLERERKRDALRVVHTVAAALSSGQVVAIFPEGTTSTGHGLLPFHANLLQAAIATATPVQPVALRFSEAGNDRENAALMRRQRSGKLLSPSGNVHMQCMWSGRTTQASI